MRTSDALRLVGTACICGVALAHNAWGQSTAPRRFDRPIWTSAEGFSTKPDIRELADGRVLVVDAKDREVTLLSATGKRIRQVGSKGAGPEEYTWPIRILPLPGDSTLVVDRELRRVLIIGPDALPKRVETPPTGAAFIDYDIVTDATGAVIYPASWKGTEADPTVPLLRWQRGTNRVDSISRMKMRDVVTAGDPKKTVVTRAVYYSLADVLLRTNGAGVFVLRARDYHLDWIRGDRTQQSFAPIPYEPIALSSKEKATESSGGPGIELPVPGYKPAFNEAYAAPDGEVWVRRMQRDGAAEPVYDIINARGARTGTATMAKERRIVGISEKHIFIARTDDDGLNWLEAHPRR